MPKLSSTKDFQGPLKIEKLFPGGLNVVWFSVFELMVGTGQTDGWTDTWGV